MIRIIIYIALISTLASCTFSKPGSFNNTKIAQTELKNSITKKYVFLDCMYQDSYFPEFLVDKCRNILLKLCYDIETNKPKNTDELYKLTHSSTIELNNLQDEFFAYNSEIETGARECLAINFEFIADSYGFESDIEELIATRKW